MNASAIAGSAAVNDALQIHLPQLALTRSRAERLLLILLPGRRPADPGDERLRHRLARRRLLATAPKLIVEIDGTRGHRTPAQIRRDHQRDLELRQAGYIVLRYTEDQLESDPEAIVSELRRYL